MRVGCRLGVDVGTVRVGVAASDRDGVLAFPVETVARDDAAVDRLVALADEYDAVELVVGLPLTLRGTEGASAADARAFASALAARAARPVRLVDERLSTTEASRGLRDAGRSSRRSRTVVDQAAAVTVLQAALDEERSSGRLPGVAVDAP